MAENKLTSIVGIVVLVFIVTLFAYLISDFGVELSNSDHAELSTNSQNYIATMTGNDQRLGFNISDINGSTFRETVNCTSITDLIATSTLL